MEKLPGIISAGILLLIVILCLFYYKKIFAKYPLFLLYILLLFCYEWSMLITGMLEIGNHIIANINTLVYYTVTLLMIIPIYKHYSKSPGLVQKGILTIAVIVTILWGAENFLFGHGILIYNSLTPGIASILIGLIAIYLLNVFIFANSDGFFKDPDVLIITGVLVRSITFGFGLWLFKFDLGFDIEFLSNLLIGINVGLCLSDLFFLLAISRIGSKETVRVER